MDAVEQELLLVSAKLLQAIDAGDWAAYASLCDPTISCFEPESLGHVIVGLPFHQYYFDLPASQSPRLSTIASPHVRVLGESAVVSYTRVVQKLDGAGSPVTVAVMETRVWHKQPGGWKHVHFHRSPQ